jgi:hypothetical protein
MNIQLVIASGTIRLFNRNDSAWDRGHPARTYETTASAWAIYGRSISLISFFGLRWLILI